jgi:V/A-type H+-transporting ATPase subunit A
MGGYIMNDDVIYSINGPVIKVKESNTFSMLEMVYVGKDELMGEVIAINKQFTTIQVYESTTGLQPGEPVISTGSPIYATLGPGILRNIFDGIQRPLQVLADENGPYLPSGSNVAALDEQKQWDVTITVNVGDYLSPGHIYATVPETKAIVHYCMLAPNQSGEVVEVVTNGQYTVHDTIIKVKDDSGNVFTCTLVQKWPIKEARPVNQRLSTSVPLVTGQRVIDTLFPIAKGGTAALPGGFGTGKTTAQHQIAKWCDADIIVYIGCGERGNEMTQVLEEFKELVDPRSNTPLSDRTILIANTSNMPVAARESSIYTGLTLAEYYRDMGYHVAIMADSTSRWAEALREISGRLEEMPAEEGFPAYLPSRLSQFYERAGYMETLNNKEGSITVIGAVSPQGADFSEPVTQNTKRFVRCFWVLDTALAYARHYFAINWNESYSDYVPELQHWLGNNISPKFIQDRQQLMRILALEEKLSEIVKLMGWDVLPEDQKLIIEIARVIRVGYLQQNVYDKEDGYVSLEKQWKMMEVILYAYERSKEIIDQGKVVRSILETGILEAIMKMKYDIPNNEVSLLDAYYQQIDTALQSIV